MSNPPRLIISILITATRILGKAFLEAGKQAIKNAKHAPQNAIGNDIAGVGNATTGSIADQLTRQHRMTLDEAHLILNVRRGDSMEAILKHYEHLYTANSPPPSQKPAMLPNGRPAPQPAYSHYLQSKVVRARDRIEAEMKVLEDAPEQSTQPRNGSGTEPPPPSGA